MPVKHYAASSRFVLNYRGTDDMLLYLPRTGLTAGRIPIIYGHGYNQTAGSAQHKDTALLADKLRALAALGHPVAVPDLGGGSTWGSDDSWDAVDDTVTWLGTNYDTRTDRYFVGGESHGALPVLNNAWRNASKIVGILLLVPVINLAAFKTRNNATFGPAIETAYTNLAGYNAALPTHDPSHINQRATLQSLASRAHIWHTTSDEFIPPSEIIDFCSITGWGRTQMAGTHVGGYQAPVADVVRFVMRCMG